MQTLRICLSLIRSDLTRLKKGKYLFFQCIRFLITNASFKITFWFRIGSYLKNRNDIISKILYFLVILIYKGKQYKTGIQLPLGTPIGKGLSFSHFSCIVINNGSFIGDFCTIFQGVTIGSVRGKGAPKIGNYVVIAAGAKVIGDITIGNNVFIGANAVVASNIPDNAVVGGIPAKIINMKGVYNTSLYR